MIQIGIFSKIFKRDNLDKVVESVVNAGFKYVQFNMECAGLQSLPEVIEDATCRMISETMKKAGVTMVAISGTFNAIHPDLSIRKDGIARVCKLISKCNLLGTNIVTLCSGTRDSENMWRYHPDNNTSEAWKDLVDSLYKLCSVAEKYKVTLALEPEIVNVINNAKKAKEIIKDVGSDALKVVIDPANLITKENIINMDNIIEEAITLLGQYIVLSHAKDIDPVNPEDIRLPAGKGCLNYGVYLRSLRNINYKGALILHGLSEQEVPESVEFLSRYVDI